MGMHPAMSSFAGAATISLCKNIATNLHAAEIRTLGCNFQPAGQSEQTLLLFIVLIPYAPFTAVLSNLLILVIIPINVQNPRRNGSHKNVCSVLK